MKEIKIHQIKILCEKQKKNQRFSLMLVMPSDPKNLSNISLRGILWWSSGRTATSTAEDLRVNP